MSEAYYAVSTIKIKPGKAAEVLASLEEVAQGTRTEPGAKFYRFYKTEGKDEVVCMEKFTSREAYKAHQNSDHVQAWAKKYLFSDLGKELFDGGFEFWPLGVGEAAGGFDRE